MKCLVQKSNDPILDALGINVEKITSESDKVIGWKKKKTTQKETHFKAPKNDAGQLDANQAINFFEALNDNAK